MKEKNSKGFSLIELLAVVLIIATLAAISLPFYSRAVLKSRATEVQNLLTMVRTRQVIKYAKDKEYAQSFEDRALSKIALGPSDYETNNGIIKTVNGDYELRLINKPETENSPAQNCVIGSYKPDGDTKFTFAIAYNKSGLACQDGNINWSICDSFGTVVSNNIEEVCAGQAEGQETCAKTCGECFYQDVNCDCVALTPDFFNNNFEFNATVGESGNCQSCKYCTGEDCSADPERIVKKEFNTETKTIESNPEINDQTFECTDRNADLWGLGKIDCAEYDPDSNDPEHPNQQACLTPIYQCHSAYYKVWNQQNCAWQCSQPEGNICNGNQIWNNSTCSCVCKPGMQCHCHVSQVYANRQCQCKAGDEAVYISDEDSCLCTGRPEFGEIQEERVFNSDYTHCKCQSGRQPVFFGTITDPRGGTHVLNIPDALTLASSATFPYWQAACCRDNEFLTADSLPDFEYDACCPFTQYKEENTEKNKHIDFSGSERQCCSAQEPFYNSANTETKKDPNPQYANRSAGTYTGKVCHKCPQWFQAYDEGIGCYACPGITFTNLNGAISDCSCPTGTTGQAVIIENGQATENCACTKLNTEWKTSVAYIANATAGFVDDNTWHANNGACKCTNGYTDTYLGKQIGVSDNANVSPADGHCCPNGNLATIYNNNGADTYMSGQKACCPANSEGIEMQYFHNTNYAGHSCGVCPNQTDTYYGGMCQPCADGFEPVWNAELGYSLCQCPPGTTINSDVRLQYPGPSFVEAQNFELCKCNLANATWQWPAGVGNNDFIAAVVNNNISSLPGWDSANGYCSCNSDYTFATHGTVNGTQISSAGYCCPNEEGGTNYGRLWNPHYSNYCCDSNVAFYNESPYQCCTTSYYHTLATLTEDNQLEATYGSCGACSDPKQTWVAEPGAGKPNCQDCEKPKIPQWNNSRTFGYSTCQCPPGSHEAQTTEPSWWQRFLSLLGLGSSGPAPEAILGNCQCSLENSVWVEENERFYCTCPEGFTNEHTEGQCCPNEKSYYWQDTGNYSSNPSEYCHKCPSGSYEYTDNGNYSQNPSESCHKCPNEQYEWTNGSCNTCPENRPHSITIGGQQICAPCEEGYVWSEGACHQPQQPEECTIRLNADGQPYCECENQSIWTASNGCACQAGDAGYDKCLCYECITNNPMNNNLQENPYWILRWDNNRGECSCLAGRQYTPNNCSDSSTNCCPCVQGRVETPLGGPYHLNGCCLTENVAPNNSNACCGKTSSGVRIQYGNGTCCTAEAPYYNETKQSCVKCSETQYYDSTTQSCKDCQAPMELAVWTNGIGYAQCKCPAGTTISNTSSRGFSNAIGGQVPNTLCYCEVVGTTWNSSSNKCLCASGKKEIYNSNNELIGCCPNDKYHINSSGQGVCCYSDYPYWSSSKESCAKCPETQYYDSTTQSCKDCQAPMVLGDWQDNTGYTQCECPSGTAVSNTGGQIGYFVGSLGGELPSLSSCKCPADQYYVNTATYEQSYSSDGQCKPCPQGSTWNGNKCVCDNSQGYYLTNSSYRLCSTTTTIGGDCSCKKCPVASTWQGNQCGCSNGFTLIGGKCSCSGTNYHVMDSQTLSGGCQVGDTNCVCAPCPSGMEWESGECTCIIPANFQYYNGTPIESHTIYSDRNRKCLTTFNKNNTKYTFSIGLNDGRKVCCTFECERNQEFITSDGITKCGCIGDYCGI